MTVGIARHHSLTLSKSDWPAPRVLSLFLQQKKTLPHLLGFLRLVDACVSCLAHSIKIEPCGSAMARPPIFASLNAAALSVSSYLMLGGGGCVAEDGEGVAPVGG